jgi:hypothetical protein
VLSGKRLEGTQILFFTSRCGPLHFHAETSLLAGTYDYDVGFENSNGSPFAEVTGERFVIPAGASTIVLPAAEFVFQRGPVTWMIERNGSPVTCAEAGAVTVEVSAKKNGILRLRAACADPSILFTLQSDTYEFSARLLGTGDKELASWTAPSQVTLPTDSAREFPQVSFELPPR